MKFVVWNPDRSKKRRLSETTENEFLIQSGYRARNGMRHCLTEWVVGGTITTTPCKYKRLGLSFGSLFFYTVFLSAIFFLVFYTENVAFFTPIFVYTKIFLFFFDTKNLAFLHQFLFTRNLCTIVLLHQYFLFLFFYTKNLVFLRQFLHQILN